MKTVYLLYRKDGYKPFAPVFYNASLEAYESYDAALDNCDLEKEVIVKARLNCPDQISDADARKRTLKQYRIINKGEKTL